jgi:hypothetical protein
MFQVTGLVNGLNIAASAFESAYNRIFSGLKYFAVTSYSAARDIINRYDSDTAGNQIVSIFQVPKRLPRRLCCLW